MPVVDDTARQGLDAKVRRALFASLSPLRYHDVELGLVDETLASVSLQTNTPPLQVSPSDIARKKIADALLYIEVTKESKLWLLVYSHIKLRLQIRMIDTRLNEVLYDNDATLYKHTVSPPTSLVDIASIGVTTLWDLRDSELDTVLDEMGKRIAKTFPDPQNSSGKDTGIDGVFVTFAQPLLHAGEELEVEVRGTPGQNGTFDVGKIAIGIPLTEPKRGVYKGTYVIPPGVQDDTGIVQAHLKSHGGLVTTMSNVRGGFRIDSIAPKRPQIQAVRFLADSLSLQLGLPNISEGQTFEIFRTEDPAQGYEPMDKVNDPTWVDDHIEPEHRYSYVIKAIDANGNASLNSPPYLVKVPPHGPTDLPLNLTGDTVLHAYSSPYRITRTTLIPSGSSLRVDPGTVIQFGPGGNLRIEGDASFEGSADDPIHLVGKPGGTLILFQPKNPSSTLQLRQVDCENFALALDARGGNIDLEHVRFSSLTQGIRAIDVHQLRLSRCVFANTNTAIEGKASRMSAEFCEFRSPTRGISIDCPELNLRNNDFLGDGMAISQLNPQPARVNDNFFDSTDPLELLERIQGPCVFNHIYRKRSIKKITYSPSEDSYEICRERANDFLRQGDDELAQRFYLMAWALRKEREVGFQLAELLKGHGQLESAMLVTRTLVVMNPNDPEALQRYAKSLDDIQLRPQAARVREQLSRLSLPPPSPQFNGSGKSR